MGNTAVVFDHGALQGLGDDDHTQYLKSAGDTITGNISVDSGITIDGVDLDPDVMLWGLL